jgi:hypothetical protein
MWYVKAIDPQGETKLYEHLSKHQASLIHKQEYLDGATVVSGKMKKNFKDNIYAISN